jgi:hypothetical protein
MILNALSPQETEEIITTEKFIKLFDELLTQSREENLTPLQINTLTSSAYSAANEIRSFKLHIIKRQLTSKILINFPPTFLNHMVNEVDEYLFILSNIMNNRLPVSNPIHYHLLWLLDGAGHASGIMSDLDMVENYYIKRSEAYLNSFKQLYIKSVELCGYMRTGLYQFPSLGQLNTEADNVMNSFKDFLKELEKLVKNKRILGSIQPLVLDHMFREECYYLTKLSYVSDIKTPQCDPTKPRVE